MEQPYVSVIVPAFNAGSTLKECLQSLHTQTYPHEHYEVIVVDDGSTDQTPVIAQSESRTVFLQQTHEGPATARNLGSLHARGNILIFTDADCTASETFIEEMVKPFNDPHIVGVKGAYRSLQKGCWARFAQIEFEERYAKLVKAESIDFVDSHAAAFRKDTFCEVGGFDPHFPVANNEDVDLSYKIARLGYRMVFNPNAIVFHHHPDNALRYLRTKFLRAYWRMLVYRRFPEKILSDTYTPQTLKIQIAFTALIFLNLFLGLFKPAALYGLIYLIAGFLLATLPFIYRVSKHDPKLILFSEFALFCRSLVFGLGVIAGFLSQRRRDLLFPTILIISDIIASFAAYTGAFWI
ncbi:glycosyltransferase, partial [bacterium]|nr:glycosyltransferase [candidate division CSSED10-310 bacterium]